MHTSTQTHSITHARYVAAKISADLKRIQRLVGRNTPSDERIRAYEQESIVLLRNRYIDTAVYGFQDDDHWTLAVKYVTVNGEGAYDHDPGFSFNPFAPDTDVKGYFGSVLTYSDQWRQLSDQQKAYIRSQSPILRISGSEPKGDWDYPDKTYRSGDISVRRYSLK